MRKLSFSELDCLYLAIIFFKTFSSWTRGRLVCNNSGCMRVLKALHSCTLERAGSCTLNVQEWWWWWGGGRIPGLIRLNKLWTYFEWLGFGNPPFKFKFIWIGIGCMLGGGSGRYKGGRMWVQGFRVRFRWQNWEWVMDTPYYRVSSPGGMYKIEHLFVFLLCPFSLKKI